MCELKTELAEIKVAQLEMCAAMIRVAGMSEAAAAGVVELLRTQQVADLAPSLIERLMGALQQDNGLGGFPLLASALDDIAYVVGTVLASVETEYNHGAEQADALRRRFVERVQLS